MRKLFGFCLLAAALLASSALSAQSPDSLDYSFGQTELYDEGEGVEEYEPSDEEKIIQDESDEARQLVLKVEDLMGYVQYLLDADSLVLRYAIYKDEGVLTDYSASASDNENLDRKFEVVDSPTEDGFFYCKEYVYNQNKAWDYIYERLYDQSGKLIFFVRQYNTYNSGCAEVAFERSEYFWNEKGDLIRKTYDIYDSHNHPLDIQECWMEREAYEKIMDKAVFLSIYPFPKAEAQDAPLEELSE